MPSIIAPAWGLKRNVTPQFGARLVQEGGDCTSWLTVPISAVPSAMSSCVM